MRGEAEQCWLQQFGPRLAIIEKQFDNNNTDFAKLLNPMSMGEAHLKAAGNEVQYSTTRSSSECFEGML